MPPIATRLPSAPCFLIACGITSRRTYGPSRRSGGRGSTSSRRRRPQRRPAPAAELGELGQERRREHVGRLRVAPVQEHQQRAAGRTAVGHRHLLLELLLDELRVDRERLHRAAVAVGAARVEPLGQHDRRGDHAHDEQHDDQQHRRPPRAVPAARGRTEEVAPRHQATASGISVPRRASATTAPVSAAAHGTSRAVRAPVVDHQADHSGPQRRADRAYARDPRPGLGARTARVELADDHEAENGRRRAGQADQHAQRDELPGRNRERGRRDPRGAEQAGPGVARPDRPAGAERPEQHAAARHADRQRRQQEAAGGR